MKIVISSGHGSKVQGAVGPSPWGLHEHEEAVRVVDQTAVELRKLGVEVITYEDTVSTNQDENLKRIVDYHNSLGPHDLDVSVHFNSATFNGSNQTSNPVGCEVFYQSSGGQKYAKKIVDAICINSGLKNRGAKDGNLYFLSHTAEVAVLVEVCFVNSKADVQIYTERFSDICRAIASAIASEELQPPAPEPPSSGVLFTASGTCSTFGGPSDLAVTPAEGLAFFYRFSDAPWLLLKEQPPYTTGLARRLDPGVFYLACRWDYSVTSKEMLGHSGQMALVTAKKTGISRLAHPADWGPHEEETGRAADLSPALAESLGVSTDDIVDVVYPFNPSAQS